MNIAKYIDHTILKPDAAVSEVEKICNEALEYNFASVCVNPCHARYVHEKLKNSSVKTCVVIGFPLGAGKANVKAFEAAEAIDDGADEIDMVINIGALLDKNYELVENDIKAVVNASHPKAIVKVIIECCLLDDGQKVMACRLAKSAGADFVKTSTGFSKGGAKKEDVRLMKITVRDAMKIKAAGGIRDLKTAMEMIDAGADRIGASAGIAIVKEAEK